MMKRLITAAACTAVLGTQAANVDETGHENTIRTLPAES